MFGELADYVAEYEFPYVRLFGACYLNAVGMRLIGWNLCKSTMNWCCLEGLTDETWVWGNLWSAEPSRGCRHRFGLLWPGELILCTGQARLGSDEYPGQSVQGSNSWKRNSTVACNTYEFHFETPTGCRQNLIMNFSGTVAKLVETSVHKHWIQVVLLVVPFNLRPLPPSQWIVQEVMIAGESLD